MNFLHLIFGPSLAAAQSQNPRCSAATPAVLLNRRNQIHPKSERNIVHVILEQALILVAGYEQESVAYPVQNLLKIS